MVGFQLVLFYSEHQRPSEQMFWLKKKLSWQISREWKNSLFKQFILLQTASLCLYAHTHSYAHIAVTTTVSVPLSAHTLSHTPHGTLDWHSTQDITLHAPVHAHVHTPHHHRPPFHTCTQPFSLHKSSQPALYLRDFKDKCGSVISMECKPCTLPSLCFISLPSCKEGGKGAQYAPARAQGWIRGLIGN